MPNALFLCYYMIIQLKGEFMKKTKVTVALVLATILSACSGGRQLQSLKSFITNSITYSRAYELVSNVQKSIIPSESSGNRQSLVKKDANDVDPAVAYFLGKYKDVTISYEIETLNGSERNSFEIRGEVFLEAIQNNIVSITSSMPNIKYLFISNEALEALESQNQTWKESSEALLSPFNEKFVYGQNTVDHLAMEIKDFTSAGGGQSTTETSNEFSFSQTDNRLVGWQFQIFVKNETTTGTKEIQKTIQIEFEWHLKN